MMERGEETTDAGVLLGVVDINISISVKPGNNQEQKH
jgi:hypothetical protein